MRGGATTLEASLRVGGVSLSASKGSAAIILTDEDPAPGLDHITPGVVLYATGTLSVSISDFASVNGDVTVVLNSRATDFAAGDITAGGGGGAGPPPHPAPTTLPPLSVAALAGPGVAGRG